MIDRESKGAMSQSEPRATMAAGGDLGVARRDLLVETGDLQRLLGRPTEAIPSAVAEA
jgi:NAD(P)H dehydrogenase (quinone)